MNDRSPALDVFNLPLPENIPFVRMPGVNAALDRLVGFPRLREMYVDIKSRSDIRPFIDQVLESFNISVHLSDSELSRIPKSGPAIVVANHPFGLIEGIVLAKILSSVRPDFKILANYLLGSIPEMREMLLFVDPFTGPGSQGNSRKGIKQSVEHLKNGGLLAIFPAGEVSHFQLSSKMVTDPRWSDIAARISRLADASTTPVFFHGANNLAFQVAGLLHPSLRTLLLPRQLLNKRDRQIHVKIGNPIPFSRLNSFTSDEERTAYLRFRTYLLGEIKPAVDKRQASESKKEPETPMAQVADSSRICREIAGLNDTNILIESGDFAVYHAQADHIPETLLEIGRLREITFRSVGEGSGNQIDLDDFDEYYRHLFIWNRARCEIVGAYRLGPTDEILARFGKKGLYTSTLFRYRTKLLEQIDPALEMGRSFVRPEYQRNFSSLLLLWKGIGQFVSENPRYKILFGPVSISGRYHSVSQQMMISFLKLNNFLPDMARLVRPYHPPRFKPIRLISLNETYPGISDIDNVSELIADIDSEYSGVPVLLKQYLKLGGKLISFNVDPEFNNALDGLILVDLTKTDRKMLDRYMGKEGADNFLSYHEKGKNTSDRL